MVYVVHSHGDSMYFIKDPERNGFLTWDFEGRRYLMGFTTGDKAEEYNEVVLKHQPGEVVRIDKRESLNLARKMVAGGVTFMVVDYPVINDQEFWDQPVYQGAVPAEVGRNYSIVDLTKIVREA